MSLRDSQILKGVAICAMLWHHLFYVREDYGVVAHQLGLIGKVCVSIFLFVSGYGLWTQYNKIKTQSNNLWIKNTAAFELKRYVKFFLNYWPVFFVVILAGVCLFGRTLNDAYSASGQCAFFRFFLDFCGIGGAYSYNSSWWFNKLILVLYLFFPVLFVCMENRLASILTFIVLFLLSGFAKIGFANDDCELLNYSFHFALGMLFARYSSWITIRLGRIDVRLVWIISFFAILLLVVNRQIRVVPVIIATRADAFISLFLTLFVICTERIIHIFEILLMR